MNLKKKLPLFISLIFLVLIISACSNEQANQNETTSDSGGNGDKIVIGASLPTFSDVWLTYLHDGMKDYAEQLDDVEVIYVDAQNDASQQVAQIETFITRGVDAMVIMPVDITSAPDMVDRANAAGIPNIIVNRYFEGVEEATAFIGSDSKTSGLMQMEEVAKLLDGKGNIAIMNGELGQEAAIQRTDGNKEIIEQYPEMEVILESTAKWDRAEAMNLMENWLNSGKQIDAVVANNDEMAIGALMAAEAVGKLDEIVFAGIDATPEALKYIQDGKLSVSVFQNAKGQGAGGIEAAVKAVRGEELEKVTDIPFELVTIDNLEEYIQE
ncbi:sugar ABC transporter substrate-binding protein [Halalkalibacter alkaliphilus]|uniref:Sugar ABC transporter substrate-binding protein n=1 Tax=Halalkalibacter alkaliphilus TaxID=2917993 RepID=A0A9X2A1M2_9BACI|nr:sugar ABC transporter substrate-binding protein [Halalkalibacter alkaliphilus]MCL7746210.1 sugar ABC transporter substrate-binding protein [Halalkalibacter alkaliphilus]